MISIITPTYNREKTLTRLYLSLCSQSELNFEWIVIDDGSTDATRVLISNFIVENKIKIIYKIKKNGGKHSALNVGSKIASGEWILIVDSDDWLTGNAIQIIGENIKNLDADIAGLCYRKKYANGSLVGRSYERSFIMSTPTEAGKFFLGDLAYVFRTRYFQEVPFPLICGEKFVPELYIWNQIGDMGNIKFYCNEAIYYCEYLSDGYTFNFKENLKKNPQGFMLYYVSQIGREKSFLYKAKNVIRSFQCAFYIIKSVAGLRK